MRGSSRCANDVWSQCAGELPMCGEGPGVRGMFGPYFVV